MTTKSKYEGAAKKLEEKAAKEGLVLSFVNFNELFIDLDDTDDLTPTVKKLQMVRRYFMPPVAAYKRRSKSGTGWHIRVVMPEPIELRERVALHAIIGSDPVRELLRLRAIRHGTDDQQSAFLDRPDFLEESLEIPEATT